MVAPKSPASLKAPASRRAPPSATVPESALPASPIEPASRAWTPRRVRCGFSRRRRAAAPRRGAEAASAMLATFGSTERSPIRARDGADREDRSHQAARGEDGQLTQADHRPSQSKNGGVRPGRPIDVAIRAASIKVDGSSKGLLLAILRAVLAGGVRCARLRWERSQGDRRWLGRCRQSRRGRRWRSGRRGGTTRALPTLESLDAGEDAGADAGVDAGASLDAGPLDAGSDAGPLDGGWTLDGPVNRFGPLLDVDLRGRLQRQDRLARRLLVLRSDARALHHLGQRSARLRSLRYQRPGDDSADQGEPRRRACVLCAGHRLECR